MLYPLSQSNAPALQCRHVHLSKANVSTPHVLARMNGRVAGCGPFAFPAKVRITSILQDIVEDVVNLPMPSGATMGTVQFPVSQNFATLGRHSDLQVACMPRCSRKTTACGENHVSCLHLSLPSKHGSFLDCSHNELICYVQGHLQTVAMFAAGKCFRRSSIEYLRAFGHAAVASCCYTLF